MQKITQNTSLELPLKNFTNRHLLQNWFNTNLNQIRFIGVICSHRAPEVYKLLLIELSKLLKNHNSYKLLIPQGEFVNFLLPQTYYTLSKTNISPHPLKQNIYYNFNFNIYQLLGLLSNKVIVFYSTNLQNLALANPMDENNLFVFPQPVATGNTKLINNMLINQGAQCIDTLKELWHLTTY